MSFAVELRLDGNAKSAFKQLRKVNASSPPHASKRDEPVVEGRKQPGCIPAEETTTTVTSPRDALESGQVPGSPALYGSQVEEPHLPHEVRVDGRAVAILRMKIDGAAVATVEQTRGATVAAVAALQ